MSSQILLYAVSRVAARRVGSVIEVRVEGEASSGGWSDLTLIGAPQGDTLRLELVGQAPDGMSIMMVTPVKAVGRFADVSGVARVVVSTRTNKMEATVAG